MSEAPEAIPGEDGVEIPVPVVALPVDEPTLEVEAQLEEAFGDIDTDTPLVGIVMDAPGDKPGLEPAMEELTARDILHEIRVMSAQDETQAVGEYARNAQMRGLKVIIVAAGHSVLLPGLVAAHTELPVIAVPLATAQSGPGGLDALLAVAQMPADSPVAVVGVDAARNAAILAARILRS